MSPDGLILTYSEFDSTRFGLRVHRVNGSTFAATQLVQELVAAQSDIVIMRLPSGHTNLAKEVSSYRFPMWHADTLVYYQKSLALGARQTDSVNNVVVEQATLDDVTSLSTLAELIFVDYPSHYATNSLFDPKLVAVGYAEWACRFVDSDNRQVLIARADDHIIGFLTLQIQQETAEIVLNGVHPAWTGRGVYGKLLRAAEAYSREAGSNRIIVSTQVGNIAVQRAWHREGFQFYAAYDTFHITPLLHTGTSHGEFQLESGSLTHPGDLTRMLEEYVGANFLTETQISSITVKVFRKPLPKILQFAITTVSVSRNIDVIIGKVRDADQATMALVYGEYRKMSPRETN